jgi:hypothetical protein
VLGGIKEGVVHADPDPDDVLVLSDGRLAILDFGASATVDAQRAALAATALDAFAVDDQQAFAGALGQLGWVSAGEAADALALARHTLGVLAGPDPTRLDVDAVVAARERLLEAADVLERLVRAGAPAPEDLWPARGAAQLFGTIARVGASGHWLALAQAALHDGWRPQSY